MDHLWPSVSTEWDNTSKTLHDRPATPRLLAEAKLEPLDTPGGSGPWDGETRVLLDEALAIAGQIAGQIFDERAHGEGSREPGL